MKNSRFAILLLLFCLVAQESKASSGPDDVSWVWMAVTGSWEAVIKPGMQGLAYMGAGAVATYIVGRYLPPTPQEKVSLDKAELELEGLKRSEIDAIAKSEHTQHQLDDAALTAYEHRLKNLSYTHKNKAKRKAQEMKIKEEMKLITEKVGKRNQLEYKRLSKEEDMLAIEEKNEKLTEAQKLDIKQRKEAIAAEKEEIKKREEDIKKKEEKIREKYKKKPAKPQEPKVTLYSKFVAKCALIQAAAAQNLDFLASKSFAHITNMNCFKDTAIQTHAQTINRALVITSIAALMYGSHKLYKKYTGDSDDEDDFDNDDEN